MIRFVIGKYLNMFYTDFHLDNALHFFTIIFFSLFEHFF